MSRWTHALCAMCWGDTNPGRTPHRIIEADLETCCRCGDLTRSGIYVRHDPNLMRCGGVHGTAAE